MIEQDTIKLLRECDAGVKMGISSIEEVIDHVKSEDFRHNLSRCKQEHEALQTEINQALDRFGDDPQSLREAGEAYATEQIIDLVTGGVRGIHLYSMNKPDVS